MNDFECCEQTHNDRDELAWKAASWAGWCTDNDVTLPELAELCGFLIEVKRALLDGPAAGYRRPPETVETEDDLDALPVGTVIRTSGTERWGPQVAVVSEAGFSRSGTRFPAYWEVADCEEYSVQTEELDDLPATILYRPAGSVVS